MNGAGKAGIKGMDGTQNFKRLVRISHRCTDQSSLIRATLPFGIPW